MRKIVILLKFVFLVFGCASVQSQTETSDCSDLTSLEEINLEEIRPSMEKYLIDIESDKNGTNNENTIKTIYCPPTILAFEKNCSFPINANIVKFYVSLLDIRKDTELILYANSDTLEYKENPEMNLKRAETVKKIFTHYGIDSKRILIKNLGAEYPMDTNKTEQGRQNNKYVRLSIPNIIS